MIMVLFSIIGSVVAQGFVSFNTMSTSQKIYDWDGTPLAARIIWLCCMLLMEL